MDENFEVEFSKTEVVIVKTLLSNNNLIDFPLRQIAKLKAELTLRWAVKKLIRRRIVDCLPGTRPLVLFFSENFLRSVLDRDFSFEEGEWQ